MFYWPNNLTEIWGRRGCLGFQLCSNYTQYLRQWLGAGARVSLSPHIAAFDLLPPYAACDICHIVLCTPACSLSDTYINICHSAEYFGS
jgi:hypothetical protein